MYTLYTRPGSGGFVVEAALAMADAPFRQID
ncbi:glutathione S-transferase family protein, partial [Mesorhizobium sp. M2E.F.Ca.ET.154.01.1.1]